MVECLPSLGEHALRQYLKEGYINKEGIGLNKVYLNKKKWSALDVERFKRVVPKVTWMQREFTKNQIRQSRKRSVDLIDESVSGESIESRLKRLQKHIREKRVHLIINPDDISWLLNVRGNDFPYKRSLKGVALVAKHYAAFFSDLTSDQKERLQAQATGWMVVAKESTWEKALEKLMSEHAELKLEIEFHRRPGCLNQDTYEYLEKKLSKRRLSRRRRTLVELGRIEKNSCELTEMKQSGQHLSDLMQRSIEWVKKSVVQGVQLDEFGVKKFIMQTAKRLGASRPCFPPIVASGNHSSSPHHMHGNRVIEKGDVVMLDIGFYFEHAAYATDMTRSFVVGDEVTKTQKMVYTELLKAFLLQWGKNFKEKELSSRELDLIGRNALAKVERLGYAFCHSTGHGVGIVDHELALSISSKSKMLLRPNYTYSIEPGCYANEKVAKERFGMRLEDVVVTEIQNETIHHVSLAPCPFEENLIDRDQWNEQDQKKYEHYMKAVLK
jgi:Xaa-Pro aminopeptidase